MPFAALAASADHALDGAGLSVFWVIPFVCMLLSIAVMPLVIPHFWHHHYGKTALFWGLAFVVPCALIYGFPLAVYQVVHVVLSEYIPFLLLLLALFTVAGGVALTGDLAGSPKVNTALLAVGTFLASWMGTTGAAMLLIRPMLRANAHRQYKVHSVVFFIFLVANIGGSLTPLGDPPLFLGFLKGVSFFWTTSNLLLKTILISVLLLGAYFCLDVWLFNKEGRPAPPRAPGSQPQKLGLKGSVNLILLLCIVGSVLMSGIWNPGVVFHVYGTELELQNVVRDALMIAIALISLRLTPNECHELNGFSWEPILEVGKLFFGIFLSMIPAIAILRAGTEGALAPIIRLVTKDGQPANAMYFWLTGLLSSFLDNAPTYLVFFNTAGGDPVLLMGEWAGTLTAISAGAVFMGAITYIGNAPNFMVRSIAIEKGVKMPSFFGYMVWSVGFLYPCFGLLTWLFFV
jgi:Na+/H+ antiporter NhaD/arsenite permease-like protein